MPCPDRGGAITDYEEVWRVLPPIPGPARSWILESVDGDREEGGRKTFLGRIGGGYMALSDEKGTRFAARSEEWDREGKSWRIKYEIGDVGDVPSLAGVGKEGFEGEEGWVEGGRAVVLGKEYLVRAVEALE